MYLTRVQHSQVVDKELETRHANAKLSEENSILVSKLAERDSTVTLLHQQVASQETQIQQQQSEIAQLKLELDQTRASDSEKRHAVAAQMLAQLQQAAGVRTNSPASSSSPSH